LPHRVIAPHLTASRPCRRLLVSPGLEGRKA
jgi:hypothetical protein